MRDKSKIIAFILSAVPGLAHLYIRLKERALIFFTLFAGLFVACLGLSIATYNETFIILFMFAYPVIWLVALIDMFSAWKKLEIRDLYTNSQGMDDNINIDMKMNKKTITLALSIIPGAGHMYLGYQSKGLFIMGAFFFSIFFMGWLGISLLLFLLPLIWFYSFFDAMHLVDGSEEIKSRELELPRIKPEWLGAGLIGIGIMIILERILYPMIIDYHIRRYIQTSIVSLIFIVAGIFILNRNKKALTAEKEVEDDIVEEEDHNED